ncbi:hypothetical protein KKA15_01360 [Patescibacteria group bacterium]|nr:hypothetical protein [Patescibacteria group bacterium]
MDSQKMFAGLILMAIGLLFVFNNKNMAKGAAALYQKLYTEKNLIVMFKIAGVILVLGGLVLMVAK